MSQNEEQEVPSDINAVSELQPLSEEEIQLINALQTKLSGNTALSSEIEMVIREHLRTSINANTLFTLLSGLELYLDENTVYFLLETLRRSNDVIYLEQVKAHCPEQFWGWLRRLIALYADDFRNAYKVGTENPNSWDTLNRHAYFDVLTQTWSISLEIVKYNGERLALEETTTSSLFLVHGIIDMLLSVPAEEFAPDLVDKETLANIYHQFGQLIDRYAPGLLAELAEKEA